MIMSRFIVFAAPRKCGGAHACVCGRRRTRDRARELNGVVVRVATEGTKDSGGGGDERERD
jgi:hypothetical protein